MCSGFSNYSAQDIAQHLCGKCGELDELKIEALDSKLTAPFGLEDLSISLIKRTEDIMDTAEATNFPCADTQNITKTSIQFTNHEFILQDAKNRIAKGKVAKNRLTSYLVLVNSQKTTKGIKGEKKSTAKTQKIQATSQSV